MKVLQCPVCDSMNRRVIDALADHLSGERYPAARCSECGVVYLTDPPAVDEMEVHYANPAGRTMRQAPGHLFQRMQAVSFAREMKPLLSRTGRSSLLDLGAGDGALLKWAADQGLTVAGIDFFPPSEWPHVSIPYAAADLHGGRFTVDHLTAPLGKAPNAVVMRHVLEHLHAPREALATLASAGVEWIYVVVPNADSLGARLFGQSWYYWDPPRHLTFFSNSTLRLILRQAGFDTVVQGHYGIDDVVTSLHRKLLLRGQNPEGIGARLTQPKGLLAGLSSAAASWWSDTVCWAVARRMK